MTRASGRTGGSPSAGTAAGTFAAGNDSRIVGAVQASTVDAKGDILAATADNTVTRLAAGSNGQVLTAQSGQSTGLQWAGTTDTTTVPLADATVGAAGSQALGSPRDHAHPRYEWAPPDHGWKAWTVNHAYCAANSTPATAGTLMLVRCHLPVAASITSILMYATSGGSALTSGQNFSALYTAAGVLVGQSADQTTAWAGNGQQNMALTGGPFACAAGDYYVGLWFNGTTSPAWARATNLGTSFINAGLSAPNLRVCTANTGLTTTAPGPFGAQTAFANLWFAALV